MPLPLPNLDTRRWEDLAEEARAIIPRHARSWTDHNIHDPGMAILEMLAWLAEQEIYRLNRVPDAHRRRFLALAGFAPRPPQPARVPLTFTLKQATRPLQLQAGFTVAAAATWPHLRFQLEAPLTLLPVSLQAVQVYDGTTFQDRTRLWQDGHLFPIWGEDPQAGASLYLGFDSAFPHGQSSHLCLWLQFSGGRGAGGRAAIASEDGAIARSCQPPHPAQAPHSAARLPLSATRHHSVETVWEYFDGNGWQPLAAGAMVDRTRGMTLDGVVQLEVPASWAKRQAGAVDAGHYYVRCRLQAGRPDAAPRLETLALNTAPAVQRTPAYTTFPIVAGATVQGSPTVGSRQQVAPTFGADGQITGLEIGSGVSGPEVLLLDFQQPALGQAGSITMSLVAAGRGDGLPEQALELPAAAVAGGEIELWAGGERWQQRPNLDASGRADAHFVLDAATGTIRFGDGEQGRVLPAGAWALTAYQITDGGAGNLAAGATWALTPDDRPLNEQRLASGNMAAVLAAVDGIDNPQPATGGADAETLDEAAGRAAARLWAHERLVELCPPGECASLDQQPQAAVLARTVPRRATTLLDFERLALAVPGTDVRRARAWAELDPNYPCLEAPGTIAVIIVPELPQERPSPTAGLLRVVRAFLGRRRTLGTRLVVTGPRYLQVAVRATLRARSRTDRQRVLDDVREALDTFLAPLQGGPAGRGWPFGRDVYRSEILQVMDNVGGVDHVLEMELVPDGGEAQCGNLCVGPTYLVTPGTHRLEIAQ